MSKINETNYPRRTQANYADTDMLIIQAAGGNTYTTRIEDLREDCQETLAPALNTMRENLATVEGSTASKAYAKGDFLVFGGRLCKAKTSIASGATLVLDTNIELDSVGDELKTLNSDLTSLSQTQTGLTPSNCTIVGGGYTKLGNLVIVNIRFTLTDSAASISGFPAPALMGTGNILGAVAYDATNEKTAGLYMTSSGSLMVPNAYGSSGSLLVSFAYPTS